MIVGIPKTTIAALQFPHGVINSIMCVFWLVSIRERLRMIDNQVIIEVVDRKHTYIGLSQVIMNKSKLKGRLLASALRYIAVLLSPRASATIRGMIHVLLFENPVD